MMNSLSASEVEISSRCTGKAGVELRLVGGLISYL